MYSPIPLTMLFVLAVFAPGLAAPAVAQQKANVDTTGTEEQPWWSWNEAKTWGLDPVVLQPESYLFRPLDEQGTGEVAFDSNLDIQLFGVDIVNYKAQGKMLWGINLGLGIAPFEDARLALGTVSLFCQVDAYFRVKAGFARLVTDDPKRNASQRDRSAWFVGMGLPTRLNRAITKKDEN